MTGRVGRLGCQLVALGLAGALTGCATASSSSGAAVRAPGGSATFAPYVDVTLSAPFDLAGVADDGGVRALTLAFVTSAGGCAAHWRAQLPIGAGAVLGPAEGLRAAGVALRVSFGGGQGSELAQTCTSVGGLEAAYTAVLDRYHAVGADFDVEGRALDDRAAMARRAAAIARLQATAGRRLSISLTLPAEESGLTAPAIAAVRSMVEAGVHLSAVNLLAMDYGSARARVDMAAAAIRAARAANRQLAAEGPALAGWRSLGLTVMIGVNDSPGEVLTLADAHAVASFARAHSLGLTSIWSLARDNPCEGAPTLPQPTCSGVSDPRYAFSRAFGANSRRGLLPRRVADGS